MTNYKFLSRSDWRELHCVTGLSAAAILLVCWLAICIGQAWAEGRI